MPRVTDDDRVMLKVLAKETRQLRNLCQSRAMKMARGRNEEVIKLRDGIAEHRFRLKNLAIKAEECQGAYQVVMDAFLTINLADSHLEP